VSLALYIHKSSPLHRLAPSVKVAALIAAGIAVFLVGNPVWLMLVLAVVAMLYAVARVPLATAARQLRPFALLIGLIFIFHGMFTTWTLGLLVVLRFAVLVLLGMLVSFTTRVSDMIETIERGMAPLAVLGVNPEKVSLALSLALRFIPLLYAQVQEIREAQRVRGLERNFAAIAVPLLVRTLRMAGDLTDAIEARGFDAQKPDIQKPDVQKPDEQACAEAGAPAAAALSMEKSGGKGLSRLRSAIKRRSMSGTEVGS
jgi:biotin transport system permease protein